MKNILETYKKVSVIGFGISGQSIATYLLKHNIKVDVYEDKFKEQFDSNILKQYETNSNFKIYFKDSQKPIFDYDILIASPGVPLTHELIAEAQSHSVESITDINLFVRIFRQKFKNGKIISVTGSNGKSTTVTLLHEVLKSAGKDAYLGGNIGTSPLDFIETIVSEEPIIVLETSSYQLEYVTSKDYFDIACILNLSDNHLNRYGGDKKLYAKAKLGGIDSEKTSVIVNYDDEYTQKYIASQLQVWDLSGITFGINDTGEGVTFENNSILYRDIEDELIYVPDVNKMKLPGIHNIYNVAFVCAVLRQLDIEPSDAITQTIYDFGGLKHRIQYLGTIEGVTYINDSKSTSPDATSKALNSFEILGKKVILITGGNDKDISYDGMKDEWQNYVKGIILLPGSANTKLKILAEQTDVEIYSEVNTMSEALESAQGNTGPDDIVLLSPATDSHASFTSFEDRGNQFIQCVQNLKK
jgi:UDP-N-acetylmuramoylalanine--D-glutamate ligase